MELFHLSAQEFVVSKTVYLIIFVYTVYSYFILYCMVLFCFHDGPYYLDTIYDSDVSALLLMIFLGH